MRIYRPVKSNRKTQNFGESKACVLDTDPKVVITKTGEVCPDMYTDLYTWHGMNGHNGEDWKTWNGEPLYFPVDADTEWWSKSEVDSHGGKGVDIYSSKPIYFKELPPQCGKMAKAEWAQNGGYLYVKFRFWHLKDIAVADARRPSPEVPTKAPNVKFGQLIGWCDSTGQSSGHHLHWSMKVCHNNSMTIDADNGYYGAVDFSKDFENAFVLDVLQVKAKALSAIELAKQLIATLQEYLSKK